jgi:hypothetical protein
MEEFNRNLFLETFAKVKNSKKITNGDIIFILMYYQNNK